MSIQRIIRDEVLANASQMVTELSQGDGYYEEDLAPCLYAHDYSEAPNGYTVWPSPTNAGWFFVDGHGNTDGGDYPTERDAIIAAWGDSGDEPPIIEALQFWLVSDYLADKLEEVGALVSRDVLGFNIWGRTEFGQSLEDDADLLKVAQIIRNA